MNLEFHIIFLSHFFLDINMYNESSTNPRIQRIITEAEDFSSLFNVVLDNFESVDVFLVFPEPSCSLDSKKVTRRFWNMEEEKWRNMMFFVYMHSRRT